MSLTSIELNYLIWRYLQESGFDLAAFALQKKSHCLDYDHSDNKFIDSIGPGCLVNLVQKGILYTFVEDAAAGKEGRLTLVDAIIRENSVNNIEFNGTTELAATNIANPAQGEPTQDHKVAQSNSSADPVSTEKNSDGSLSAPAQATEAGTITFDNTGPLQHETAVLKPALHFSPAVAAQWHPTAPAVVVGAGEGTAHVYAVTSGSGVAGSVALKHAPQIQGENNDISTVAWAPQGNLVVTAGLDGEIRAWAPDGRLRNVVNSADGARAPSPLVSMAWNARGLLLVTVDASSTASVWDAATLQRVAEVTGESRDTAAAVCWVSDSKLAVLTATHAIKIYSVTAGPFDMAAVAVGQLAGHAHAICAIAFSPISKLLALALDGDYAIKVWNSLLAQDALELNVAADAEPGVRYHASPIVCLAWLTRVGDLQGNELMSVSMDGTINMWDAFLGEALVSSNVFKEGAFNFTDDDGADPLRPNALVYAAALSPNSQYLAIGDDKGAITVWDVQVRHYRAETEASTAETLHCLAVYAGAPDADICDLAWDSEGKRLCVCYQDVDSVMLEVGATEATDVDMPDALA